MSSIAAGLVIGVGLVGAVILIGFAIGVIKDAFDEDEEDYFT